MKVNVLKKEEKKRDTKVRKFLLTVQENLSPFFSFFFYPSTSNLTGSA